MEGFNNLTFVKVAQSLGCIHSKCCRNADVLYPSRSLMPDSVVKSSLQNAVWTRMIYSLSPSFNFLICKERRKKLKPGRNARKGLQNSRHLLLSYTLCNTIHSFEGLMHLNKEKDFEIFETRVTTISLETMMDCYTSELSSDLFWYSYILVFLEVPPLSQANSPKSNISMSRSYLPPWRSKQSAPFLISSRPKRKCVNESSLLKIISTSFY